MQETPVKTLEMRQYWHIFLLGTVLALFGMISATASARGIYDQTPSDTSSTTGGGGGSSSTPTTPPTQPPSQPPASTPTGGGGGGGASAPQSLRIFNEKVEYTTGNGAFLSWFTNVMANCTVLYDLVSHDASEPAPTYGYTAQGSASTANNTYHTSLLSGLTPGTYHWRAYCTATSGSDKALGQELQFIVAGEPVAAPSGDQATTTATTTDDEVTVLGYENLPTTGGSGIYFAITGIVALAAFGILDAVQRRNAASE